MDEKIRVLVVEDQVLPRETFEMIINASDRYELAGSVDNAAVADIICAGGNVDLVLMDIVTKNGNSGLKAAEEIKKHYPEIKIIIITSMPEASFLTTAKSIGVESFWYKEIHDETLLSVMDKTMSGMHVYPNEAPVVMIGKLRSDEFTDAELRILRELAYGATNSEIAEKYNLSVRTVETHVRNMTTKTGLKNRVELAIQAGRSGIVVRLE